jgi:hypothetical protein
VALSFKFYRITYSPPPLGALTSHYTQPHPCPLATLGGVGDEEVREEAATMARWRLVGEARSRGRVVVGGWRGGAQVEGEAVWGGGISGTFHPRQEIAGPSIRGRGRTVHH